MSSSLTARVEETNKVRCDGSNTGIKPPDLLKMFLEREGSQFINRFTQATEELERDLFEPKNSLEDALRSFYRYIEEVERGIGEAIDEAASAKGEAEDSLSSIEILHDKIDNIQKT